MDLRCFGRVVAKSTPLWLWLKNSFTSQHTLLPPAIPLRLASSRAFTPIKIDWAWILIAIKSLQTHSQIRCLLAVSVSLAAVGILVGCTTLTVEPGLRLDPGGQWALLPVANYTDSPQAGSRMEAILTTLLQVRGVRNLRRYTPPENIDAIPVLEAQQHRNERTLAWARAQKLRYGFTGSVEEWRYKSGVEREPAVGISLRVLDIATGKVLWAASGARSGWGRESISGTAQKLLNKMLAEIEFDTAGQPSLGRP